MSDTENNDQDMILCLKCESVPDNYICLNCNHNFCLICMAYQFLKGTTRKNINNQTEYICEVCEECTELDGASVEAIEYVIKEIIMNTQQKVQDKKDRTEFQKIPAVITQESFQEMESQNHYTGKFKQFEDQGSFAASMRNENPKPVVVQEKIEKSYSLQNITKPLPQKKSDKAETPYIDHNFTLDLKNSNHFEQQNFLNLLNDPENSKQRIFQHENEYSEYHNNQSTEISQENQFNREENKDQSQAFCHTHSNEELIFICFTCENKILCMKCTLDGAHKNHDVRSFQKSVEYLQQKMEETGHQINANVEILQWNKKKLADKKRGWSETGEKLKNIVYSNIKEIQKTLIAKEKELIQQVDDVLKDKIAGVDSELTEIKQRMTTLTHLKDSFKFIHQKQNKGSPQSIFKFFSDSQTIINKITFENEDLFANNQSRDTNQIVDEQEDILNQANFSPIISVLNQINNLRLNFSQSNINVKQSMRNSNQLGNLGHITTPQQSNHKNLLNNSVAQNPQLNNSNSSINSGYANKSDFISPRGLGLTNIGSQKSFLNQTTTNQNREKISFLGNMKKSEQQKSYIGGDNSSRSSSNLGAKNVGSIVSGPQLGTPSLGTKGTPYLGTKVTPTLGTRTTKVSKINLLMEQMGERQKSRENSLKKGKDILSSLTMQKEKFDYSNKNLFKVGSNLKL